MPNNKKKTNQEFVLEALQKFPNYNYSRVEYLNAHTKVVVICPKHGEFEITPHSLLKGCGCRICGYHSNKTRVCGVGVNDLWGESRDKNGNCADAYNHWLCMLNRCYNKRQYKTYMGCSVCNEWLLFSNFKSWFDKHHKNGWQLDKDILIKNNKHYSPQTCCFVPSTINSLFTRRTRKRGNYPIGVSFAKRSGKFYSYVCKGNGQVYLGSFNTPEEAFAKYKEEKEKWIKEVANKWKDKLEPNVYDALINYKVEITD